MTLSIFKSVTQSAGIIATDLVMRTLCHIGNVKFRKPSMTNWPAYVPVIVELYPAAKSPMAQIYFALFPKVSARAFAPLFKSNSINVVSFYYSVCII